MKDTEVKTDSTVMQSQVGNERKELIQKKKHLKDFKYISSQ